MNIVMVSNFFNHHQAYLSEALFHFTGGKYRFIETSLLPEERQKLGYREYEGNDYLCKAYRSEIERAFAREEILQADAAVMGSAPEDYIQPRIRAGKLTFRYAERPLKKGNELLKHLPRLIKWNGLNPRCGKVYLLSASAFAPYDYSRFGLFKRRAYKFGYFPQTRYYTDVASFLENKDRRLVLWCGRFVDWKYPEIALQVALRLKESGIPFRMKMIGTGEKEEILKGFAQQNHLQDLVTFAGAMTPDEVRACMEEAGIFLFTSGRREGWGAVLNEAMNSGCAVIACDQIGAVPYLLKHNENGIVFRFGDTEGLFRKTAWLLEHPREQIRLGCQALHTITKFWNAQVAAERLAALSEAILAGDKYPDLFSEGPCSRAGIIREDWFKDETCNSKTHSL